MKNFYLTLLMIFIGTSTLLISCSDDGLTDTDEQYRLVAPVNPNLNQVPYPYLSMYRLFTGTLKNMEPAAGVLPFKPASELFSDYAKKERFVWMPPGTSATYDGDGNVLNFPVGTILVKTFYYDSVMPLHTRKIIETRLLIKKAASAPTNSGWETYNYIWDWKQKDAFLDVAGNGTQVPVSFVHEGVQKNIQYKVPATAECRVCHRLNSEGIPNGDLTLPIGPKPMHLNNTLNYQKLDGVATNQLQKWIAVGYLENNLPASITSVVDWKDVTKPVDLRARAYLDINCAHCHRTGGQCQSIDLRLDYHSNNPYELGICMPPTFTLSDASFIINKGNSQQSEMIHRMNDTNPAVMMPLIGRSTVHEEGVALMRSWIDQMPGQCN